MVGLFGRLVPKIFVEVSLRRERGACVRVCVNVCGAVLCGAVRGGAGLTYYEQSERTSTYGISYVYVGKQPCHAGGLLRDEEERRRERGKGKGKDVASESGVSILRIQLYYLLYYQ